MKWHKCFKNKYRQYTFQDLSEEIDAAYENRFISYAVRKIKQSMCDAVNDYRQIVHIPSNKLKGNMPENMTRSSSSATMSTPLLGTSLRE
jgi:hypothetical protein